jgi:hypothetical protein
MNDRVREPFLALERHLVSVRDLLAADEVDVERLDAGLQVLTDMLAVMPALPPAADADLAACMVRCRDLHAAALAKAQAHRERLAAALRQSDRSAAALRSYGSRPPEEPRFVDRSG